MKLYSTSLALSVISLSLDALELNSIVRHLQHTALPFFILDSGRQTNYNELQSYRIKLRKLQNQTEQTRTGHTHSDSDRNKLYGFATLKFFRTDRVHTDHAR